MCERVAIGFGFHSVSRKKSATNANGQTKVVTCTFDNQAPVVQRVDDAIQRISIGKTNYAIRWIVLSTLWARLKQL